MDQQMGVNNAINDPEDCLFIEIMYRPKPTDSEWLECLESRCN